MPDPDHEFVAPVLRQPRGFRFHYVPLPEEVAEALERAGTRRVVVELNGFRIRRAVMNSVDVGRHLVAGRTVLRDAGARLGDMVHVALWIDPDPEAVDIPEELEAALEQDPKAAARFASFTHGQQRSLALYVTQAKRTETRVRRSLELATKLRTYTLYGDRPDSDKRQPS